MFLRELVIFLAGAQFFNTLSHIALPFYVDLPLQTRFFDFTSTMNMWAIIINGLIAIALFYWVSRLRKN